MSGPVATIAGPVRERGRLVAHDVDARVSLDERGDERGEAVAVDRERAARGDGRRAGAGEQQAAERRELVLEQPGGGGRVVALEGVRADELGEERRVVRRDRPRRGASR